jgi:hypothetical protein
MNPADRVRIRNMPIAKDYSRASLNPFGLGVSCLRMISRLTLWDIIGAFLWTFSPLD